jgi:hypothetical protein
MSNARHGGAGSEAAEPVADRPSAAAETTKPAPELLDAVRNALAEGEQRVLDIVSEFTRVETDAADEAPGDFDAAGRAFAQRLRVLLDDRWPERGIDLEKAARAAAAQPLWERAVGRLLSPREFAEKLGVTRQRVQRQITDGQIVALQGSDGRWNLPDWQLAVSAEGRVRLARAVSEFTDTGRVSAWSAASWLLEPHPALGCAPRELADSEPDEFRMLEMARRDAAAAAR